MMIPRTLAEYVPRLRRADDDIWRMRIVLHEFGLRWEDTPLDKRLDLVTETPEPINAPWDAFLAAYVEYRCYHEGLEAPSWVFGEDRYLEGFWFPFPPEWKAFRVEARVHAPAAFEAHGTLVAERDLTVVSDGPDGPPGTPGGTRRGGGLVEGPKGDRAHVHSRRRRHGPRLRQRAFTHDIDAVILDNHGAVIAAVHEVARHRGLPNSWLNEQVSAYFPRGEDRSGRAVFDHPNLRVTVASPERILAMNVKEARPTDIPDLRMLVEMLGYTTPDQVRETTESVFPGERLPKRSETTIAMLFAEQQPSRLHSTLQAGGSAVHRAPLRPHPDINDSYFH